MANPTGDPEALFDAIHTVTAMYQLADSYDDLMKEIDEFITDYSGGLYIPTPEQVAASAAILAAAKEARRKLRELGYN